MQINTERLLLRNFTRGDANDAFEYCSQEGVGEMAGWPAHKSVDETEKILDEWINNKNIFAIVRKKNGKVIGHLAVNADSEENRDDTRELGCALNRDYQRRGIMTEAMRAVLGCLFTNGIAFVWACCFQNNIASKGMIEKCGFSFQQKGTFYAKRLDKTFPSYEYRMTREEWKHRATAKSFKVDPKSGVQIVKMKGSSGNENPRCTVLHCRLEYSETYNPSRFDRRGILAYL